MILTLGCDAINEHDWPSSWGHRTSNETHVHGHLSLCRGYIVPTRASLSCISLCSASHVGGRSIWINPSYLNQPESIWNQSIMIHQIDSDWYEYINTSPLFVINCRLLSSPRAPGAHPPSGAPPPLERPRARGETPFAMAVMGWWVGGANYWLVMLNNGITSWLMVPKWYKAFW